MGPVRELGGWCAVVVVALASCGGGGAPSSDAVSESPPADVCTLDTHACIASPPGTYCWYLDASAVDDARHCLVRHAIERCEPGRGYGMGLLGCYHVRLDGGVEQTVITPDHWPDVRAEPGFVACTTDEYVAAAAIPLCP